MPLHAYPIRFMILCARAPIILIRIGNLYRAELTIKEQMEARRWG